MAFARVYYPVNEAQTLLKAGDLHFQDGKPLLVFKWRRRNGVRMPEDCIELDPARLQRASANGTIYRYEGSIATRERRLG